jgi:uncharacterized protein YbaA (DUF1428 family)
MAYVDGFVTAVPTANRQQFIEHARLLDAVRHPRGGSLGRRRAGLSPVVGLA